MIGAGGVGPDLSIVIVCFNDAAVLQPCLKSIYAAHNKLTFEVILVDNASRDGSVAETRKHFPQVRVVEAECNAGYAGGNNLGFKHANGKYVLFLNPDTLLTDSALDVLLAAGERNADCGAIGPKLLNKDGSVQVTCCFKSPTLWHAVVRAFMLSRIPGFVSLFGEPGYYRTWEVERAMEVDAIQGSSLCCRKSLLDAIGAFDDDYFIYFEETDLCERIRKSGFRILYVPDARIVHLGQATTVKNATWYHIQYHKSYRRFFKKHRNIISRGLLRVILLLGLARALVTNAFLFGLTLGRQSRFRLNTMMNYEVLAWQLGIKMQGERPS